MAKSDDNDYSEFLDATSGAPEQELSRALSSGSSSSGSFGGGSSDASANLDRILTQLRQRQIDAGLAQIHPQRHVTFVPGSEGHGTGGPETELGQPISSDPRIALLEHIQRLRSSHQNGGWDNGALMANDNEAAALQQLYDQMVGGGGSMGQGQGREYPGSPSVATGGMGGGNPFGPPIQRGGPAVQRADPFSRVRNAAYKSALNFLKIQSPYAMSYAQLGVKGSRQNRGG